MKVTSPSINRKKTEQTAKNEDSKNLNATTQSLPRREVERRH
jgi:hypothetical protein